MFSLTPVESQCTADVLLEREIQRSLNSDSLNAFHIRLKNIKRV